MVTHPSKGTCLFCNSMFGKAGMTKHLQSCIQQHVTSEKTSGNRNRQNAQFFHIVVEGRPLSEYWMHLKTLANARLEDLDEFLRNTWLECCGHMSAFEIQGMRYTSSPMAEYGEKGMGKKLRDVLRPHIRFFYEYDFGTTTELTLRVLSEGRAETRGTEIQVLARNEPPSITCDSCKNTATCVCTECVYSDEGWLCDECARKHKCGEDMLLPVVNSPRVGMCGYAG